MPQQKLAVIFFWNPMFWQNFHWFRYVGVGIFNIGVRFFCKLFLGTLSFFIRFLVVYSTILSYVLFVLSCTIYQFGFVCSVLWLICCTDTNNPLLLIFYGTFLSKDQSIGLGNGYISSRDKEVIRRFSRRGRGKFSGGRGVWGVWRIRWGGISSKSGWYGRNCLGVSLLRTGWELLGQYKEGKRERY